MESGQTGPVFVSSVGMSVDQSVCQSRCLRLTNPLDLGHKGWKYTTVFHANHQALLKPLGNVARDVDEGESVGIITAGSPMVGTPTNFLLILLVVRLKLIEDPTIRLLTVIMLTIHPYINNLHTATILKQSTIS